MRYTDLGRKPTVLTMDSIYATSQIKEATNMKQVLQILCGLFEALVAIIALVGVILGI